MGNPINTRDPSSSSIDDIVLQQIMSEELQKELLEKEVSSEFLQAQINAPNSGTGEPVPGGAKSRKRLRHGITKI